ncbi:hypothetical protein BKA70DRAFT_1528032 [Coprinopsis sp. MPI-PUGE-AT-0042]|nr:hypothetical protein BKA70DRAFT_1528032 [Coprinopsis sp. MPI-PUGE-AT-0042]
MQFLKSLIPLALALAAAATPIAESGCTTVETFIGQNKDVKVTREVCADGISLNKRQDPPFSFCFAPCEIECAASTESGPHPVDCGVIEGALRFESENTGDDFVVESGGRATMTYKTCKTTFGNQVNEPRGFCREGWASTLAAVSDNCKETSQITRGGRCSSVAASPKFFVEVSRA